MEKLPKRKRDSGLVDVLHHQEGQREKVFQTRHEAFNKAITSQDLTLLSKTGIEKPEELVSLIADLNNSLREFLSIYGAESVSLGLDQFFFLDWGKLSDSHKLLLAKVGGDLKGLYSPNIQKIVIFEEYEEGRKLYFAHILAHEMLHFNAYQAVELGDRVTTEGENIKIVKEKRLGLNIFHGHNGVDKASFHYLDEAVIEELTIRFEKKYLSKLPTLEAEYRATEAVREAWSKDSSNDHRELGFAVRTKKEEADGRELDILRTQSYPYKIERDKLNKLVDDLFDKNRANFNEREEIFNLFVRAVMAGELKPLVQLIDTTLGRGSFKKLGEEFKFTLRQEEKNKSGISNWPMPPEFDQ